MTKDDNWILYGAAAGIVGALLFLPHILKQTAGGGKPCETCGKTEEEKAKEPDCGCNAGK